MVRTHRPLPWRRLSVLTAAVALAFGPAADRPAAQSSPVILAADEIMAGLARGDWFGEAVAISGDIAVVGAPLADVGGIRSRGAVYVFIQVSGRWVLDMTLTGIGSASERFGSSVAVDGDFVVVGAPAAKFSGKSDAGAAYLFQRSAVSDWQLIAHLRAPSPAEGDRFGAAVAISGGVIAVGAPFNDGVRRDQGAVYVFNGSQFESTKIVAPDGSANANLGAAVAVSVGGLVLAGAPGQARSGSPEVGAAYLFDGVLGALITAIQASDSSSGDNFGCSVALTGSAGVVGACADDVSTVDQGSAYVFEGLGSTSPSLVAKLTASDSHAASWFGSSVAMSADGILIGAPGHGTTKAGSVYFFQSDGAWHQSSAVGEGFSVNGRAGTSVALSGTDMLYGAPLAVSTGAVNRMQFATTPVGSSEYSISVAPSSFEVFSLGSVQATVRTSDDVPASGVVVSFTGDGIASSPSPACTTNASGMCAITLFGPVFQHVQAVTACVHGAVPSVCDETTVQWFLPLSTTGAADGSGVLQPRAARAAAAVDFSFNTAGRGKCQIKDANTGTTVRCADLVTYVQVGAYAYFYGFADVNGVMQMFRLDVKDGGQSSLDTFTLIAEQGYVLAGTVMKGNIQVK